jgi:hypothetical protein
VPRPLALRLPGSCFVQEAPTKKGEDYTRGARPQYRVLLLRCLNPIYRQR